MKKNRTIGKRQVEDAARARGLLMRRVKTVEGLRWEVSNGKGLRAFYVTLREVWLVVMPRPVQLPEEEGNHEIHETDERREELTTEDTEQTEEEMSEEVGE